MNVDFGTLANALMSRLGESFPNIIGAVAILLIGWIVALIARFAVRRGLGHLGLNRRLAEVTGSKLDVESASAIGVYFLVLLLALIAFFNTLNLAQVSSPLSAMVEQVLTYLPNLIAAGVLALLAWILATLFRALTRRGVRLTKADEKLKLDTPVSLSDTLGNVVYGLTLLLFLPGILDTLGLDGLLAPVAGVVDGIIGLLPNLLAAVAIGVLGWLIARILRDLTSNLVAATGADKGAERLGLRGTLGLSKLCGLVVFVFVLIPTLIAALDALEIEAVSTPATQVLGTLMDALPYLFAATLIIVIAVFIADLAATLGTSLLGGIGFDRLPEKLGLAHALPKGTTPSVAAGQVLKFVILLLSLVEAAKVLGFDQVSRHLDFFVGLGGKVLLGVVIIAVGLWIARLTHGAVARVVGDHGAVWAGLARFAILGLFFAMGLDAMGIAETIVTRAFTLILGAVAVAAALSFGLGGREAAGRQVERWLAQGRGGSTEGKTEAQP